MTIELDPLREILREADRAFQPKPLRSPSELSESLHWARGRRQQQRWQLQLGAGVCALAALAGVWCWRGQVSPGAPRITEMARQSVPAPAIDPISPEQFQAELSAVRQQLAQVRWQRLEWWRQDIAQQIAELRDQQSLAQSRLACRQAVRLERPIDFGF